VDSRRPSSIRYPRRLLVVEDDPELASTLADVLGDEGFRVAVANDGLVAWQMLHEEDDLPDVILLDMRMPQMDGATFRRRQLQERALASIPTLVMTGHHVDSRTRTSMGRVPILRKPIHLEHLLATILEVVQAGRGVKECACGRKHDAEVWRSLRWVGEIDNGRNVGERLELRHCPCGSTLAWEVGKHAVSINVPALR